MPLSGAPELSSEGGVEINSGPLKSYCRAEGATINGDDSLKQWKLYHHELMILALDRVAQ